jgi:peptide methionine sulfoxide reductase MsrB
MGKALTENILRKQGTERPFQNEFNDNHKRVIFCSLQVAFV